MNTRIVLIIGSTALCAVALAGVVVQGRQLGDLRLEHQRLVTRSEAALEIPKPVSAPVSNPPSSGSPPLELLRLRNEINQLTTRQRELQNVSVENDRLRVQVAVSRTNKVANSALSGFIRKSTARMAGFNSPEDTLETLMWAVQNRDLETFKQAYTPNMVLEFQKHVEQSARKGEDFFKGSESMPPMRVAEREQLPDGSIELTVQMGGSAADSSQKLIFKQINGQWKMDIPGSQARRTPAQP